MNIDVAVVGIDSRAQVETGFAAAEPEDTGGNERLFLLLGRQFGVKLTSGFPSLKDHAEGGAFPYLFDHPMQAARCAKRVFNFRRRPDRGGDIPGLFQNAFIEIEKFLLIEDPFQGDLGGGD